MSIPMLFLTARSPSSLAAEIDRDGFACIENYVAPERLDQMRGFVADAIARSNGRYAMFKGPDEMAGSTLDDMAYSTSFRELMHGIYTAGTGRHPPNTAFYQILRCLNGQDTAAHSMRFHYDSYVLTALIPIEIPTSGLKGDLLLIPNSREIRGNYVTNLFDKVMLDNALSQRWLKRRAGAKNPKVVRLSLVPGNLYFFWGYRSIHTNEPCDPDKVRATALFHYADPHENSWIKKRMKRT